MPVPHSTGPRLGQHEGLCLLRPWQFKLESTNRVRSALSIELPARTRGFKQDHPLMERHCFKGQAEA
jgi:hypothetical protein